MSDPCGNWEEDVDLEFDIDLHDMPDSSQEASIATLHEDQGQEVEVKVLHYLNGEEVTDE